MNTRQLLPMSLAILLIVYYVANGEDTPTGDVMLPNLDGTAAKGINIDCRVVKKTFSVGEPVNILCTIKNDTKRMKPIPWHTNAGCHFCCVQSHAPMGGGILPRVFPQLDKPLIIKSSLPPPQYIIYLPAHESMRVLLTYRPSRPEKFIGKILYDPLASSRGSGFIGGDGPPWKDEFAYSNEFEYEVVVTKGEQPTAARDISHFINDVEDLAANKARGGGQSESP